jgi:hypothetical protein
MQRNRYVSPPEQIVSGSSHRSHQSQKRGGTSETDGIQSIENANQRRAGAVRVPEGDHLSGEGSIVKASTTIFIDDSKEYVYEHGT